jgi:phage tail-like protein
MPALRPTPYGAFNFTVTIGGDETIGGFSDVTGLSTEFTMAEYREGSDPENHVRKVPGVFKAGDITLKRGIISSEKLWAWVSDVRARGVLGRKDLVVIKLLDEARGVVQSWTLYNVTPQKFSGPALAAKGGTDVAMEELVLSAETIEMGDFKS